MSTRHTGTEPRPETPDLTWARAHLREQIQRAGTELTAAARPQADAKRQEDRELLPDMEAEP